MMLVEVDVESNDIRLTEPLTLQATNDDESWQDPRRRSHSNRHDNSRVVAHFIAGMVALFILAAIVFFNRQSLLVQCEGNDGNLGDGTNVTILGDIAKCNITAGKCCKTEFDGTDIDRRLR